MIQMIIQAKNKVQFTCNTFAVFGDMGGTFVFGDMEGKFVFGDMGGKFVLGNIEEKFVFEDMWGKFVFGDVEENFFLDKGGKFVFNLGLNRNGYTAYEK